LALSYAYYAALCLIMRVLTQKGCYNIMIKNCRASKYRTLYLFDIRQTIDKKNCVIIALFPCSKI